MKEKDFLAKLVDSRDRSVEPHIVFTGWGVVFICICALAMVYWDYKDFHLQDLGTALGMTIGLGGGAGAAGQGLQTKLSPPASIEAQDADMAN